MNADIIKKDIMIKQAQENARMPNSKSGLNPMNMYMGQAKSSDSDPSSDDEDSSYSQERPQGNNKFVFGDPVDTSNQEASNEAEVEPITKGVLTVASPLPDIVEKKKRRNTITKHTAIEL